MKYRLERKDFQTWKSNIYLLPTINISIDDMMYINRNFSIEFHWLVFHGRLLFMKQTRF